MIRLKLHVQPMVRWRMWTMKAALLVFTVLLVLWAMPCSFCHQETPFMELVDIVTMRKMERRSILKLDGVVSTCHTESLLKPNLGREPQTWYKVPGRNLYVYSSFYETREEADGPTIRIIATGWQEQFHDVGRLYCHLWYEDRDYPIVVGPAIYNRIYPSLSHADMYVSHFILCKLPSLSGVKLVTPYAVSVVPNPCDKPLNHLLVMNREIIAKKGEHALCVSTLYNNFKNWTMIAEIFELHKLLGAEEINIYKHRCTPQTDKLIDTYLEDKSFKVNKIEWGSYPNVFSNVLCQRGALNDCLYRMGHKYKYVTITDLDEILVPRMVRTWQLLMRKIASPQYGAYLFQHAYYRRNYTLEEASDEPRLITQTSFWRTDVVVPAGKIRCKSMYFAEKAVSIDLHFPYLLTPGAKEYIVKPEEGMLHHYRSYPMESFVKHPENYNYIEDRYMEWMKENLIENVRRKILEAKRRM